MTEKTKDPIKNLEELLSKKVDTQKEISVHLRLLKKEIPALQQLIKELKGEKK